MRIYGKQAGSLIRKKRIELNMSQEVLTRKLGWQGKSTQYLSNCELGKNPFPAKHIGKISSALWLDPSMIIEAMTSDYNECLKNTLK